MPPLSWVLLPEYSTIQKMCYDGGELKQKIETHL